MNPDALCLVVTNGNLPEHCDLVIATQRLRGAILREFLSTLRPGVPHLRWEELDAQEGLTVSRMTGKNLDGTLVEGGMHPCIFPLYGQAGEPDRLYVWRKDGFLAPEIAAIVAGAQHPIQLDKSVFLQCLPFGKLPLPASWTSASCDWESVTPFVPPPARHRFRPNGKPKNSETPPRQIQVLCRKMGLPEPEVLACETVGPVQIHWNRHVRQQSGQKHFAQAWPGYRIRLRFPEPVTGPLWMGNSCHFGTGLFQAVS